VIRYALACAAGHEFDSWFADSAAYDKQRKKKLVACPACGSIKVEKAIMAPRLGGNSKEREVVGNTPPPAVNPVAMLSPQEKEIRQKLRELRDHLTHNAENVGPKFPDQARKMHYGDIEHRSIYGEASPKDAQALAEEGIEFHPLPVLPDDKN
jgi:hypothetical protein